MLVISKKRIKIILAGMLIAIFTFTFQIAQKNTNQTTINSVSIETTATPVSGKTVVIDAGHGAPDERSTKFKWYNRSTNKPKNCI